MNRSRAIDGDDGGSYVPSSPILIGKKGAAVHTLYRERTEQPQGDTLWRNPTDRHLKIVVYQGKRRTIQEVEPGGTIGFPAAWPDATVKNLCKFLVRDNGSGDRPTRQIPKPAPAPAEAKAPLGDASKVQSEDDRKDAKKEATHSSGDALEAYAQTLMKKSKDALKGLATDLGLETSGSKSELARAIALKSVEGAD